MAQDERNTVYVDYEHLASFDDGTLADEIQTNYVRSVRKKIFYFSFSFLFPSFL